MSEIIPGKKITLFRSTEFDIYFSTKDNKLTFSELYTKESDISVSVCGLEFLTGSNINSIYEKNQVFFDSVFISQQGRTIDPILELENLQRFQADTQVKHLGEPDSDGNLILIFENRILKELYLSFDN